MPGLRVRPICGIDRQHWLCVEHTQQCGLAPQRHLPLPAAQLIFAMFVLSFRSPFLHFCEFSPPFLSIFCKFSLLFFHFLRIVTPFVHALAVFAAHASSARCLRGAFCRLSLPRSLAEMPKLAHCRRAPLAHCCAHIGTTALTARASSYCQSLAITGSRESERPS